MTNSIGQILLYESLGLSHLLKANKPTEAIGYLIKEGIKRDIRQQRGIEKMFARTSSVKEEPAQAEERDIPKSVNRARDDGRQTMANLANRAQKRRQRYLRRIAQLQIGGKPARQKEAKIKQHNPGQPATKTLSDKAIGEKAREEGIRYRFNV